jgi:hypothetical protein
MERLLNYGRCFLHFQLGVYICVFIKSFRHRFKDGTCAAFVLVWLSVFLLSDLEQRRYSSSLTVDLVVLDYVVVLQTSLSANGCTMDGFLKLCSL